MKHGKKAVVPTTGETTNNNKLAPDHTSYPSDILSKKDNLPSTF